jgi:hypothetical protein
MKYIKFIQKFLENNALLSKDEEENIIIPNNVEITGHHGSPIKKIRSQKITKEPKVKTRFMRYNYPSLTPEVKIDNLANNRNNS